MLRALLATDAEDSPAEALAQAVAQAMAALDRHAWSDEEHRVVYACWCAARRNRAIPLQQEMAAHATRMGHPEIDWPTYFQANSSAPDLPTLLKALASSQNPA